MNICKIIFPLIAVSFLILTGCTKTEEVHTVDWYMAEEHWPELSAKLVECENNPGQLRGTPNCSNAVGAFGRLPMHSEFMKNRKKYPIK
jgi:hypothetical protein